MIKTPETLDMLRDVNIPSPTDDYVLAYNATTGLWEAVAASGGVTDHGALTGLADDDHSQYHTDARGDARYLYRENVAAFTPDGNYEPATKKYVDDNIGGGGLSFLEFTIEEHFMDVLLDAGGANGTGNPAIAQKVITAVGCTGLTKANGFLVIELKCTAGTLGEVGQIELTSSGTWDDEEWHIDPPWSDITTEWKTFILPLANAVTQGGELNPSKGISFIRWYNISTDGNVTIYWKNAHIRYAVPIPTGVSGYLEVPAACTISQVTMLANESGSIIVDIWKDTYANFPPTDADSITAVAPPTITTAQKSQDSTLTNWTISLSAGDILAFNVDSCTTITKVTIIIRMS